MGFQSIVNFFMPKEDRFYALLENLGKLSYEATQTLSQFSDPNQNNQDVARLIQDIEHRGDTLVTTVEEELAKTFVTPLDREDIHRIAVELDDIIDFCNQAARACVLFRIEHPTTAMTDMFNILVSCTKHISEVIPDLRTSKFERFFTVKVEVKELEKAADKIYRAEITRLFDNANSGKSFISQKEVLDKLENAVDRCEDIMQFLITLAVKHG
jgi:predicted phosphate transport protein (TIGR00153 family)